MNNPIGIFDSGVGGLSVWLELSAKQRNEDFIYLADSNNCPYGEKTHNEILQLSIRNTEFLLAKKCKLIVVACNTATAAAIDYLRENYAVPFVGMEPAVKPAALNTKTGKIGILATQGTFKGRLFRETSEKYANNIKTIIQPGYGLVELVEENKINTPEAYTLIEKYIKPMITNGVDKIVLGCTHYPFLQPVIKRMVPEAIEIINPAPAIAQRTIAILNDKKLISVNERGESVFYTSGNPSVIESIVTTQTGHKPEVKRFIPPYTN